MSIETDRLLNFEERETTNQLESDLIKTRPITIEKDSKKSIRDAYGIELFQNEHKKKEYEAELDKLFTDEKKEEIKTVETKSLFQDEKSYTIINTKQELTTPMSVYIFVIFILTVIAIKLALIDWKGLRNEKKSNNDD